MAGTDASRVALAAPQVDRDGYEAPAAFDAGPAEQHTRGLGADNVDNPDGPHQGYMQKEG